MVYAAIKNQLGQAGKWILIVINQDKGEWRIRVRQGLF